MASKKKDLTALFHKEPPPPTLRRGQGLRLSTDRVQSPLKDPLTPRTQNPPPPPQGVRTSAHEKAPTEPKRVSRGYNLREDLVKACKRIALEEDRTLYEVMEDALAAYLSKKARATR